MARKNAGKEASPEQNDAQGTTEEAQENNVDQEKTEPTESVDTPVEFKAVSPNIAYSRSMIFPSEFTLPMSVVAEVGAQHRRYQIMSDTQEVPEPIIRWLKSDARYSRWFV